MQSWSLFVYHPQRLATSSAHGATGVSLPAVSMEKGRGHKRSHGETCQRIKGCSRLTGITFLSQSGKKEKKKTHTIFIVEARSSGRERQNGRVRMTSVSTVYFGDCLQVAGNMAELSCHGNTISWQMTSWHKDNVGGKEVRATTLPVRQAEGGRKSTLTHLPIIKCQMYTTQ